MTTHAAFTELLSNKEKCISTGMSETNYRKIKQRFNEKKELSLDKKIYWLKKAKYKLLKDMDWGSPIANSV